MSRSLLISVCVAIGFSGIAEAGVKTQAAREVTNYVSKKFGKEALEEGAETFARKVEVLAVKHGDDALTAVKKVGPRALPLVEEAGENGPQAIKLMARHGDDAVWVVAKKNRMAIFINNGDDAAEAMIKHGELAEPLIQNFGKPAAETLKAVTKQNGRRLAMMADDGTFNAIGRSDELLQVIGKYGDRGMDFVWRNKASLAVAGGLTAFLTNPQPFIDGTADISMYLSENVAKPLVSVPGDVAREAARHTNWTIVFLLLIVVFGGITAAKVWLRRRPTPAAAPLARQ